MRREGRGSGSFKLKRRRVGAREGYGIGGREGQTLRPKWA